MEDYSQWRLQTSNGIRYKKVNGASGNFSYEGATATEEYIIRAQDLLSFATYGFPEPYASHGNLFYPAQPTMPGLPLVPHRISWKEHEGGNPIDPFGADPSAPSGTYGEYVRVVVEYGVAPSNDSDPDQNDPFTFLEVSQNASGVFLNSPVQGKAEWEVPGGATFSVTSVGDQEVWEGESSEVLEASVPNTVVESQIEWNIRWPSIPWVFWNSVLMARLRDKLGKVNDAEIPLFLNAPVDTILFLGFSASASYTWRAGRTGMSPITLDMKFLEKNFSWGESSKQVDVTHQHIWRPNYGWRKLKIDGQYLYAQTDLNNIWAPV